MKKVLISLFCVLSFVCAYGNKLDINIIYEASMMKVKETACGWQPDLSLGYIMTEEECYQTAYELDVPMHGFSFEPRTGAVPDDTKLAYYLSFFDSATPKDGLVLTEVIKDGSVIRPVKGLKHDRTFQGLVILRAGESIRFSSKAEPSYLYIYIIATIVVAAGVGIILRKRR